MRHWEPLLAHWKTCGLNILSVSSVVAISPCPTRTLQLQVDQHAKIATNKTKQPCRRGDVHKNIYNQDKVNATFTSEHRARARSPLKLNKFQYQIHFIFHINGIFHPFIISLVLALLRSQSKKSFRLNFTHTKLLPIASEDLWNEILFRTLEFECDSIF